ncbi:MAG TPA: hypothetical protein VNQ80_10295 [Parapedobacter sp.]|nr:hypothetical protein [Parapedobacter sp.]HWK57721.1 hypothetical protein [Parapedobacter sp.]
MGITNPEINTLLEEANLKLNQADDRNPLKDLLKEALGGKEAYLQ